MSCCDHVRMARHGTARHGTAARHACRHAHLEVLSPNESWADVDDVAWCKEANRSALTRPRRPEPCISHTWNCSGATRVYRKADVATSVADPTPNATCMICMAGTELPKRSSSRVDSRAAAPVMMTMR